MPAPSNYLLNKLRKAILIVGVPLLLVYLLKMYAFWRQAGQLADLREFLAEEDSKFRDYLTREWTNVPDTSLEDEELTEEQREMLKTLHKYDQMELYLDNYKTEIHNNGEHHSKVLRSLIVFTGAEMLTLAVLLYSTFRITLTIPIAYIVMEVICRVSFVILQLFKPQYFNLLYRPHSFTIWVENEIGEPGDPPEGGEFDKPIKHWAFILSVAAITALDVLVLYTAHAYYKELKRLRGDGGENPEEEGVNDNDT